MQRQYTGTAGKIENAQVGVFLAYASPRGHVLLDRRLYLPRSWAEDAERREGAGVPEGVTFQTKPQLAGAMLEHLWARGLPMGWVAGDEVYGNDAPLRERIAAHGYRYVLSVSSLQRVWTTRPAVEPTGRPRLRARLAAGEPPALAVADVVALWPAGCWQRLAVGQGEQGERLYDWGPSGWWRADDLPGGGLAPGTTECDGSAGTGLLPPRPPRRRPWRSWRGGRPSGTWLSRAWRRARGRRGWTSTRCAAGTAGTATSRWR